MRETSTRRHKIQSPGGTHLLNLLGALGGFFIAFGPLFGPPIGLFRSADLVGSSIRPAESGIPRPEEPTQEEGVSLELTTLTYIEISFVDAKAAEASK